MGKNIKLFLLKISLFIYFLLDTIWVTYVVIEQLSII